MSVSVALTVAGSDSGGGAGIQADLKTFAAHGVHGTSAITAITVQNSLRVLEHVALEPRLVVAQIEAVAADMPIAAVKTGMLATMGIVTAVASCLRKLKSPHLVVDPVITATSGDRLVDREAVDAILRELLPLAAVVTPNLPEMEALLGRPVRNDTERREAARALHAKGPRVVVLKGGHLAGDPVDLVFDGTAFEELPAERIATPHTHGTGCTFSAAIAARLAKGHALNESIRGARRFVIESIRHGYAVGRGHGPVNPLHALSSQPVE